MRYVERSTLVPPVGTNVRSCSCGFLPVRAHSSRFLGAADDDCVLVQPAKIRVRVRRYPRTGYSQSERWLQSVRRRRTSTSGWTSGDSSPKRSGGPPQATMITWHARRFQLVLDATSDTNFAGVHRLH